jgi:potassium voltage-gated channel Eag-related subfamily H protein 8
VVPYRIALIDEVTLTWFIIDVIIDILFFLDVVVNLNLAFFDLENEIVTSRKRILQNYARGWLAIDLIACIPLNYAISELSRDYNTLIRVARLPRLYRLVKIAKLAKIVKDS